MAGNQALIELFGEIVLFQRGAIERDSVLGTANAFQTLAQHVGRADEACSQPVAQWQRPGRQLRLAEKMTAVEREQLQAPRLEFAIALDSLNFLNIV